MDFTPAVKEEIFVLTLLEEPDTLVGMVPGSVGILVVDVDLKNATVAEGCSVATVILGPPLTQCLTRSGGKHLFYRAPDTSINNGTWLHGDIRHARGFVIVWNEHVAAFAVANIKSGTIINQDKMLVLRTPGRGMDTRENGVR